MDGMEDVMWSDSNEKETEKAKAGSSSLAFSSPSPISAVLSYWKGRWTRHPCM